MIGKIIYEDDGYILADFSDDLGINYRLVFKKEYRSASIYSYTTDMYYVVSVKLSMGRYSGDRIDIKRIMKLEEYNELRKRLAKIKTPLVLWRCITHF